MFDLIVHRHRDVAASSDLATVEERLGKIETAKKPSRDLLDVLQIVFAILTPAIIAGWTWWMSGRFDLALKQNEAALKQQEAALKQKEAAVGFVKDIEQPILDLAAADSPEKARPPAMALAAYGDVALGPLMSFFRTGTQSVSAGAEEGLRSIGTTRSDLVCAQMQRVIGNRTAIYSCEHQKRAIGLIRELDCQSAVPDLLAFDDMLTSRKLEGYKTVVLAVPAPDQNAVDNLHAQIKTTVAALTVPERK